MTEAYPSNEFLGFPRHACALRALEQQARAHKSIAQAAHTCYVHSIAAVHFKPRISAGPEHRAVGERQTQTLPLKLTQACDGLTIRGDFPSRGDVNKFFAIFKNCFVVDQVHVQRGVKVGAVLLQEKERKKV